ncbi:hypothetical protein N0V90_003298 [Kalmusia sp. IMI 367209]|nr:hypothetical protein N0V90_003298 [Kalmusia sp. IMI 367209]
MPPKRQAVVIDDDSSDLEVIAETTTKPTRAFKVPKIMNQFTASNAPGATPAIPTLADPKPAFRVGVYLDTSFEFFPEKVRNTLAVIHCSEITNVMDIYQSGDEVKPQYQYTLISATATGSATAFETIEVSCTPSLSHANARLLHHFVAVNAAMIAKKPTPHFVQLRTREGLKNPKFAFLHSVRYDEIGIGFDVDKCLSLFTTSLVGDDRRTDVLYVERTEIKVEEGL